MRCPHSLNGMIYVILSVLYMYFFIVYDTLPRFLRINSVIKLYPMHLNGALTLNILLIVEYICDYEILFLYFNMVYPCRTFSCYPEISHNIMS